MHSPRKIMLLKMMGRPFLEASGESLNRMLIEAAFANRLLEMGRELPEPFSELNDPARVIRSIQVDLTQELISRN